ncbi:MAG: biopolymer transporter ExbD [Planctomycetaceae bacterium]|nr:biopolymer transporter ExbD [Planctomycetaceae bacterium]
MRARRQSKLLVESPSSATGDIAFNLIVFFLVCASIQPDAGRKQTIPKSETVEKQEENENIKVEVRRTSVLVNGEVTAYNQFQDAIARKLAGKTNQTEKIVVVTSQKDAPYKQWILVTSQIEDAGGVVTVQMEEEREVMLPQ